jgi:tRNA-dihydrouridine synthase B
MIGRAAQGKPWIFKQIQHFLDYGRRLPEPGYYEMQSIIVSHLRKLHNFYGEVKGVWFARKHVAGYVKELSGSREFMAQFNRMPSANGQLDLIQIYLEYLTSQHRDIAA